MLKKGLLVLVLVLAAGAHAPPPRAQAAEPVTHRVGIENFAFAPARIEVRAGDVVEWTNRDFVPHTATADDGKEDTKSLKNGGSGRFVTSSPGTLAYHCRFHPKMQGVIIITE